MTHNRANPVTIDADFASGSAGEIQCMSDGSFEITPKPETFPPWFQDKLDEFWDGGGVPKEYMFHVRCQNSSNATQPLSMRFLFSAAGQSYLALPWWIRRDRGWQQLADSEAAIQEKDNAYQHLDVSLTLNPNEVLYVGSAPYEDPEDVDLMTRSIAETLPGFSIREIGMTARARPILALESTPRELRLLVVATMQACEPTWMGLHHAARAWATPHGEISKLAERVQLCVVPLSNPDGLAEGLSVTNAVGEVPKFSCHFAYNDEPTPLETLALWNYMDQLRPQARIEIHAHFTHPDFPPSVGMHEIDAMPASLRPLGRIVEMAIDGAYHQPGSLTRRVRIDARIPQHDVYGTREIADRFGIVSAFLQAVSDPMEAHQEDVLRCVRTIASALTQTR